MRYLDFNFLRTDFARIEAERLKRAVSSGSGVGIECCHVMLFVDGETCLGLLNEVDSFP